MTVGEVVNSVFAGAGGGIATALLTPGAQWAVDKRRPQTEAREKVIAGARQLVAQRQDDERAQILSDQRYLAILPHLEPEVESRLREPSMVAQSDPYGVAGDFYLTLIRDEVDRLEMRRFRRDEHLGHPP